MVMIRQESHLDSISLVCEKKEVTEPLCKSFLCLCFYFPSLSQTFSYISSVLIIRARNPELVWVRNDLDRRRRSVIGAACRRLLANHPSSFPLYHVKLLVFIFFKTGRHHREECLNLLFRDR